MVFTLGKMYLAEGLPSAVGIGNGIKEPGFITNFKINLFSTEPDEYADRIYDFPALTFGGPLSILISYSYISQASDYHKLCFLQPRYREYHF
jgi:hypothetical protein